jgi:predicted aminopeptidase
MGGDSDEGRPVPADEPAARRLTEALREAIADTRRAAGVLAARVRAAHEARVWTHAEFGISRAQAYRLVDISRTNEAIAAAVAALEVSPAGDTSPAQWGCPVGRCVRSVAGSTRSSSR